VDNSHRERHGALLDAGLLAEVYLRLTRGQGMLVIESNEQAGTALQTEAVDLASLVLPVVAPNDEEAAAHEALLVDLDKACGGKTVWRQLAPAKVMA
jgi:DNA polymerase-3 subunit epsilon